MQTMSKSDDEAKPSRAGLDWTLAESLFVKEYAGCVDLFRLARDLRRRPGEVASEAARLGCPVVYMGTPMFWCNGCSCWRANVDRRSLLCRACQCRAMIENVEAQSAAILASLSLEQREKYAKTEAHRMMRKLDDPPSVPDMSNMSPLEATIAYTGYLRELDAYDAKKEERRLKTVRRRKERMQEKLRQEQRRA